MITSVASALKVFGAPVHAAASVPCRRGARQGARGTPANGGCTASVARYEGCETRSSTVLRAHRASSDVEEKDDIRSRAPAHVAAAAAAILAGAVATPALGADTQVISEFNASGLVFKDSVEVMALNDPLVDGVTLYISDFKRSISAKLQSSDFFSEPSQTSLACVRNETGSGVITVKGDISGKEGKEVFAERKNLNLLNNKTLRVRRIFHPEANSLVYISYSTRTGSTRDTSSGEPAVGQYKTSLCAVPLKPGEATVATPGATAAE